MKTYKCLAKLKNSDGQTTLHLMSEKCKSKKEFSQMLRGNGFKISEKNIKLSDVYDLLVVDGDCWAWDNITTVSQYEEYKKNRYKYMNKTDDKKYKKYFERSNKKLEKINKEIEKLNVLL